MARKLLVVDDMPRITELVCKVARSLNFEARAVNRPKEATDVFLEFQPDIVALDMLMPEMDGIDLLHEILTINPSVRLVLISGYGESFLRLAASAARFHGATHVATLSKPLRAERLAELLNAQ